MLQSGEVRRLGSTQSRHVNVRVIGASNAPLRGLVDGGTFRADLFYRLSVLTIEVPPLRARAGDIELLTGHFLQRFGDSAKLPLHLTREARAALSSYHFPGNVRELENALRRAVALSSNGLVTADCLPSEITDAGERPDRSRTGRAWMSCNDATCNSSSMRPAGTAGRQPPSFTLTVEPSSGSSPDINSKGPLTPKVMRRAMPKILNKHS